MNRRQMVIGGGVLAVGGAAAFGFSDTGSMTDYAARMAAQRAVLAEHPQLVDLVRYATLAASGHNTQPWRFHLERRRITILPDFERRTPVVDPDDHHLFVSLGCAAENLALAAAARGHGGELRLDSDGEGAVHFDFDTASPVRSSLFEAIPKRQSTRADYDGRSVAAADLAMLAAAAQVPGVDLILLSERSRVEQVLDLVLAGNRAQIADPAFVHELKRWIRFNPRQALEWGDGLFSATTGNPTAPAWLGKLLFDLAFRVASENDRYTSQIRSSAGIAVFVSERNDKAHWVQVGRACQRFALQATALGLKHAFINQPVEVVALQPELARLVGLPGRRPDVVLRFGYGIEMPFSARRPVNAVVSPLSARSE
ncbi:Tat pathway signal protein [Sphingobium sp. TCM1]|nr:Tat pathway signal protein [Sphingobium sp. TCM1]